MSKYLRLSGWFAILGAVCVIAGCCVSSKPDSSYAVYYNGKVYTADMEKPTATAFVVKDGNFVYVGSDQEALKYGIGSDMQGKRVVPGMIDSHCHSVLASAQTSLKMITVDNKLNLKDTLAVLKEKANDAEHKNLSVVLGIGFGTNCRPVTAAELDKAIPDRPAIIFSDDCHAYWFNTKAMKLAKLTKDTPDPIPGASYYERDAKGNPTGYVVEGIAGISLMRKMNIFKEDLVRKELLNALEIFAKNGITSICDAGFGLLTEEPAVRTLKKMERNGELTLRCYTSYIYFGDCVDSPEHAIKVMRDLRKNYTSDLIQPDTLKFIGDGTLEVQSAWMHEDYLPPAKGRGAATITMEEMIPIATMAAAEGFNVHNHAIGDAAITRALDFHKALGKIEGTKTICHVQVLPKDGVQRFSEQKDVFYQTTPVWLGADKFTEEVLGAERYQRQVPLASLIKSGVTVTFGSDFPVSGGEQGVNPFLNMWVAVNRATDDMIAPPKSEAISVSDCVNAYTINGARQVGAADRIGSITVGKSADFVICSDDIFTIEPQKLKDVTVNKTFFRGKCVYDKAKYSSAFVK